MISAMVLANLMYVVGAIIAATLLSVFIVFRHRRPKSLEAGIEMFSRELRALQPDRRGGPSGATGPGITASIADATVADRPAPEAGRGALDGEDWVNRTRGAGQPGPALRDGAASDSSVSRSRQIRHVNLRAPGTNDLGYSASHEARAPSPDQGDQPG
jgi:hypothetical protein